MKCKYCFVTNSSSTSYIVQNISKTDVLTPRSFVTSIWPHIQDEMRYYEFDFSKEEIIKSLEKDYNQFPLLPLQKEVMVWGDEHYTIAGEVFDYVLRDGIITGIVSIIYDKALR